MEQFLQSMHNLHFRVWFRIGSMTAHEVTFEYEVSFYLFTFREMGREGGREGEKHQCARDTSIALPPTHSQLGTQPATQACALMEPVTFRFTGRYSVFSATPA